MKRPSFQFYPADWRGNANLRRCSEAARGVWMDIMCVFHDGDEYGQARWPLAELARAAGAALKLVRELVEKGVLKGADSGKVLFQHTPRHAGKAGEPVTLIDAEGPVWFSSRMVTDEWRRGVSGGSTRFGNTRPDTKPPTKPRHGDSLGDGATSSTSSSSTVPTIANAIVGAASQAKPQERRAKRSLPDGFPAEPEFESARTRWLSKGRADLCEAMPEQAQAFRDYHTANATRSADWQASWRTWVGKAMDYTRAPRAAASEKPEWKPLKVVGGE